MCTKIAWHAFGNRFFLLFLLVPSVFWILVEATVLVQENSLNSELETKSSCQNFWEDLGYDTQSLNSSRCTKKSIHSTSNPEMVLKFNEDSRKLYLIIYSPEKLFHNGEEKFITCSTNAAKQSEKKVKLERKFKYINKTSEVETTFFVYQIQLEKYMGEYWCRALKNNLTEGLVRTEKVIAYRKKKGNEYAVRLVIQKPCESFECGDDEAAIPYEKIFEKNPLKKFKAEVRLMEIYYYDKNVLDFLLHISTGKNMNITTEFHALKNSLNNISSLIKIIYFRSSEYCLPNTTISETLSLTWPLTNVGTITTPEELCLQNDGLPMTRECAGDFFYGAEWLDSKTSCKPHLNQDDTQFLYDLNSDITPTTLKNVTNILNTHQMPIVNIYLVTKILENVHKAFGSPQVVVNDALDVINILLHKNPDNFSQAQHLLNANNIILDLLEDFLMNYNYSGDVYVFQREYIIVHVSKPFTSNITGVVVHSNNSVENIKRNDSVYNIASIKTLKVATFVPEHVLEDVSSQNMTDIHVVTTILFSDILFSSNQKVVGPVVSVSIPGYGSYLPSSLPVLFKYNHTDFDAELFECGYWEYSKTSSKSKSLWSSTGGNYLGATDSVHVCTFSHLTHFALLILEGSFLEEIDSTDDFILTIINFVGTTLTVIGICGIFLTAFLFDKWRKKQGTKILINLSVAILLEDIMLQIAEIKSFSNSDVVCRVVGSLIHYVVLSKFFWMLVYAFLQYMRFVKVLSALPERIMLKSSIFGWGFALVPVLGVNLITPYSYSMQDYHFCYPKGISLYLGVICPVVIIILVNLVVFCIVMYEVSSINSSITSQSSSNSSYSLQLKLATLLFFVLGIPWVFGVLANLISNNFLKNVLVYLFCTTSTVQGFILFLFYVVLNSETRLFWSKYILHTIQVRTATISTS